MTLVTVKFSWRWIRSLELVCRQIRRMVFRRRVNLIVISQVTVLYNPAAEQKNKRQWNFSRRSERIVRLPPVHITSFFCPQLVVSSSVVSIEWLHFFNLSVHQTTFYITIRIQTYKLKWKCETGKNNFAVFSGATAQITECAIYQKKSEFNDFQAADWARMLPLSDTNDGTRTDGDIYNSDKTMPL